MASQVRRGPDHQAIAAVSGHRTGTLLGHNRLSIIDLSAEANQPLWDAERRFCLIFNGEIYNYIELRAELMGLGHVFRTRSDSEVLLEAFRRWGTGAIARCNGMFAFALYDAYTERLFLVRDRFGVKPLYYHTSRDQLLFASTCGVLAAHLNLKPSLDYVGRGLQYGFYDDEDLSPFAGLKALQPGHYLEAWCSETGVLETRLHSYYQLPERVQAQVEDLAALPVQHLVDQVRNLLFSTVDIRFRADVPVGVSLSGGLDSSTVAALAAARRQGDVVGFTFGHPDDSHSEGPLVAALSRQTGIRVEYVRPSTSELIAAFDETLVAQGAPFLSGSVMAQYMVFKAARAAGVKVLLGGQGGDESFMGYRKFLIFRLKELLARRQPVAALAYGLSLLPMVLAEVPKAALYWQQRHRYTRRSGRTHSLRLPAARGRDLNFHPSQPLWTRQVEDIMYVSLPTLLRYEDRNSMGNSVESRLPFMDYRLVELALALPTAVKLRGGYGKWIVREAVRGRIPEAIRAARYKRGFDVGQAEWIGQGLGQAIRSALAERRHRIHEWLPSRADMAELFSDEQLRERPLAFAEATTLIWLGNHAR